MPQDAVDDPRPIAPADPIVDRLALDDDVDLAGLGDRRIVMNFAEPQAEYAAMRKACGLMARGDLAVVEVAGRDALAFLNNLLTNGLIDKETKTPMPVGSGCYSFFLNLKGRVVADPFVLRVEEERVLMVVSRLLAETLATSLDRYRFSEKATFKVLADELYVLSLIGPTVLELLGDAADSAVAFSDQPEDFPATSYHAVATIKLGGEPMHAFHDDTLGVPAVHLLVPSEKVAATWDDLCTRFGETVDDRRYGIRRLRPVGWGMFNAIRVEAGLPMLGVDFVPAPPSRPGRKSDDEPAETKGGSLPAETGPLFERAVSVTSGCYLGQEVVARMHARQVKAKSLVGIRMAEDALPGAGAPVEVGDVQVGVVTSSTLSPVLSSASIALATIKRPHFEVGTEVIVPAEGRRAKGTIVKLPFVP